MSPRRDPNLNATPNRHADIAKSSAAVIHLGEPRANTAEHAAEKAIHPNSGRQYPD